MKKLLFLFSAAVCALASWAQSTVSATVKGQELEVALANDGQAFVAFQMDIALPEGVDVNSTGAVVMNKARLTEKSGTPVAGATDANFIIAYNKIDEHTVRVLAYNLENRALEGTSGKLFSMTFTGSTSETFTIDNSLFVTTNDLEEIMLALAESTTGSSVIIGDVNRDTRVNALDLTALLNITLNKLDGTENYDLEAANVNGDDKINALDLTALLNITLGK